MSGSPSHALLLKGSSHIVRLSREVKILAHAGLSDGFVAAKGIVVVFVVGIVDLATESLISVFKIDAMIVRIA